MTTTVFDYERLLMTSDTRWSAQVSLRDGNYLLFADDTGFNKISARIGAVMLLAGNGKAIAQLKTWWQTPSPSIADIEQITADSDDVTFMIVSRSGDVLFDVGHKLAYSSAESDGSRICAIFFGSGGQFAADCWLVNRCARAAVASAANEDPCTGGDVKHFCLKSNQHNLSDETHDYQAVHSALEQRGLLMKITNKNIIPLHQHPDGLHIRRELAKGSIVASAPMGKASAMQWSDTTRNQLQNALNKVFEIEKNLN
ncbi:MAG: hypothetical protein ACRCYV_10090 [Aeromonas sp.]